MRASEDRRVHARKGTKESSLGIDGRMVMSFGAIDTTSEHGRLRVAPERCCSALASVLEGATELGLVSLVVGPATVRRITSALEISLSELALEIEDAAV